MLIEPPHSTQSSSTLTLLSPSVTSSLKFANRSIAIGAVHKVRHAIFGQFCPPSSVTLFHTSRDPQSMSYISPPPLFSRPSTKIPDKSPLYKFSLNCSWGFCPGGFERGSEGLLSERFCPWWFLSIPPSVRIHLLQQKGKHHFKFHVSYV